LRQAIQCCRNFGVVSIVGVYGGYVDKIPMGSAINRGLTFRMAQTPVQHYLPQMMERIQKEIDPNFGCCLGLSADGIDAASAPRPLVNS
jgi:threonine dehydrogenase-like Zn-dependent dehydrogenase